jgi:hypothetical protein
LRPSWAMAMWILATAPALAGLELGTEPPFGALSLISRVRAYTGRGIAVPGRIVTGFISSPPEGNGRGPPRDTPLPARIRSAGAGSPPAGYARQRPGRG